MSPCDDRKNAMARSQERSDGGTQFGSEANADNPAFSRVLALR